MKLLFDIFPLLLFFVAYHFFDIFVATGVAMAAGIAQVSWLKIRGQKIEIMHIMNLGIITIFGGATIITQNDVFVRWKPTILYWSFTLVLLVTQFFTKKTGIEYVMGSQMTLPGYVWKKMNLSFAIFFLVMGFVNIYVAFFYGADLDPDIQRDHWVYFKVFGSIILTLGFIIGLMFSISKYLQLDDSGKPIQPSVGETKDNN